MKYEKWKYMVVSMLKDQGLLIDSSTVTDDFYIAYYNDGYTPAQAIKEDLGINAFLYFNNQLTKEEKK